MEKDSNFLGIWVKLIPKGAGIKKTPSPEGVLDLECEPQGPAIDKAVDRAKIVAVDAEYFPA